MISGAFDAVKQGVGDIGTSLEKNASTANTNLGGEIATGADIAGKVTSLPFEAIGGALGEVIPQNIKDAVGADVQKATDAIKSNPDAAHALTTVNNLIQQHPQLAEFFGGLFNTALNVGTAGVGEGAVEVGAKAVAEGAGGAVTAAKDATSGVIESAKNIPQTIRDTALAQEKSAWEKPTTVAKPAYGKATDIYGGTSTAHIPETLVNNGIHLSDNVDNVNGRQVYSTTDSAEKIREDAGKMSSDILRPSLAKADASTPKTPVADVFSQAEKNIQSNKFLTPGTKEELVSSLNKEMAASQKAHPDGLGLVDLHDNKILYDSNAKYSPVGDIATNNKATTNKAIADANRTILEKTAPKDIPVKDFNSELQKQYQAANYLDALHGKPVPKGAISYIAKLGAKIVGAGVGSHFGGGILGTVGGYHLGGMVESMVEGAPASVRSSLLKNLETSNPEVFAKVEDYLKTNNLLALPKPSATITPAPSEASQMTGRANAILK
jgi:hypothetical protein